MPSLWSADDPHWPNQPEARGQGDWLMQHPPRCRVEGRGYRVEVGWGERKPSPTPFHILEPYDYVTYSNVWMFKMLIRIIRERLQLQDLSLPEAAYRGEVGISWCQYLGVMCHCSCLQHLMHTGFSVLFNYWKINICSLYFLLSSLEIPTERDFFHCHLTSWLLEVTEVYLFSPWIPLRYACDHKENRSGLKYGLRRGRKWLQEKLLFIAQLVRIISFIYDHKCLFN